MERGQRHHGKKVFGVAMFIFSIVMAVVFVLFIIMAIYISSNSFNKFKEVYDHFKQVKNSSYMTAFEFGCFVRDNVLDGKLFIIQKQKNFADAYDYNNNALILSNSTMNDDSISSISIVAHELGHAIQNKNNTKKFRRCVKIRTFVSIGCKFIAPLLLLGIFALFFEDVWMYVGIGLVGLGIALFFVLLLYKFRLLRLEKEASKLGLKLLKEQNILIDEELNNVKLVMDKAYMTYVADFFRAMLGWTGLTQKAAKP